MKSTLFILMNLLFVLTLKAQTGNVVTTSNDDSTVYTSVEKVPEFPGGIDELYRFLGKTLRYPATAREHNTQGMVVISMIVEKDGSITNIKVARSVSDDLDREALRVIKLSPKWLPGMRNGKPVRVLYNVPMRFTLSR